MKNKLLILAFFFSLIISAQETKKFSLQDAIDYALENNRTGKNAERDIEAAKQQKWEAIAQGLPQIGASVEYQNWLKKGAFAFGSQITENANPRHTLTAGVTLSQLLFDGSYIVGLQSAKVFLEISENAKEKTDIEIRKAVINAYGNVLLLEESIAVFERNKIVQIKNLKAAKIVYENGMTEEENVDQLKITVSSIESNLKNVTRLHSLGLKMLNITIGLDVNENITLSNTLENLTTENIDLNLLNSEENIENNIDYKIALNEKRSKELLLKLEKYRKFPTVSAFVNGGVSGFSETYSFATNDQKWFPSSLFGVNLSVPLFTSGWGKATRKRAKLNLEKSENNVIEIEQNLKLGIASAKSNYEFSIEEYNTKKELLKLAESIEGKNQIKYFEGIGSSFDLQQAQSQLYSAQQEFLQAMLDVINTKTELEVILNQANN